MTQEIEALSDGSVPGVPEQVLPWELKFSLIGFKRFCLFAAVIAFVGSAMLAGLFFLVNHAFNVFPESPVHHERPGVATIFGNLVFAPLVETALMIVLLKVFVRVGLAQLASVVLSAVIWGLLHGTLAPMRFAGTVWSFFVFGYTYLLWSSRTPNRAFAAASLTHSYVNVVPTVAMFIEYYMFPGGL